MAQTINPLINKNNNDEREGYIIRSFDKGNH